MESEEIVTVLTPSYNRRQYIDKLYRSLLNQTKHSFLWLIVDDGSVDGTKEYVEHIQEEKKIHIKYVYKNNSGKHTAVNLGMQYVYTPLVIIVDSDDKLLPNAILQIERIHNKYRNNKKLCGYTFLKCHADGKNIVTLDKDEFVANYIQYRIKGKRPGDMAEVFRTNVIQQFPFKEYKDEKFISEDTAWILMGEQYDTVYINIPIYQCEYLEGGLTKSDKKIKFSSPLGSMLRGRLLMLKECGVVCNLKGAIIYNCYKCNIKKGIPPELRNLSEREKLLAFITKPFGYIFYWKWRRQID